MGAAAALLTLLLASPGAALAQPGSLQQLFRPDACIADAGDGINCADGVGLNGANDVALSPDGKNLYVPSLYGNTVAVLARDPETGVVSQLPAPAGCIANSGDGVTCTDALGLNGPSAATVSPDGAHVYVASAFSQSVTIFARDPDTGALTQLPEPAGCIAQDGGGPSGCTDAVGPIAPTSVLVSRDGRHVYTAALNGNAIGVFARDPETGALAQLPAPDGCIAENGDGVTCTDGVALDAPRGLALSREGKHLYVASRDSNALAAFRRNKQTGALTQRAAPNGCYAADGDGVTCTAAVGLVGASAIAIPKNGRNLYAASLTGDTIAVFARNRQNGLLTQLPAPDGCLANVGDGITCTDVVGLNGPVDLELTKRGESLYVASLSSDAVTAFQRSKMTGVLTQLVFPNGCYSLTGDNVLCRPALAVDGASGVAVTKNGRFVYASSSNSDGVAVFEREP